METTLAFSVFLMPATKCTARYTAKNAIQRRRSVTLYSSYTAAFLSVTVLYNIQLYSAIQYTAYTPSLSSADVLGAAGGEKIECPSQHLSQHLFSRLNTCGPTPLSPSQHLAKSGVGLSPTPRQKWCWYSCLNTVSTLNRRPCVSPTRYERTRGRSASLHWKKVMSGWGSLSVKCTSSPGRLVH